MIELESAIWGVLGLLLFAAALRVNAKEEGGARPLGLLAAIGAFAVLSWIFGLGKESGYRNGRQDERRYQDDKQGAWR